MDYKNYFKGKKITQLGLGLLGRGLGDAIFLAECGADLIVTDLKTDEELKTSVDKLRGFSNVTLHLGGHNIDDFKDRDFILKGAGVPLDSIYIEEARKNNIPIEMDSSLFCKLLPDGVKVIGITGTRGKSTVTHLCSHILKNVGMNVYMGGNVRDMATLPLIKDIKSGDYIVLELDSWQLQGFGESKISPHVAVFTTFMPDHLNYYKNDLDRYFEDKANIYKYQNENDVLVVGEGVESKIENQKSKIIIATLGQVSKDWKIQIPGEHNLLNISCAVEACRALGISDEDIKVGVETFTGVEGRLQFVKEVRGIKIYNDNNATTPKATEVALETLNPKSKNINKNIILICGGADKNLEVSDFATKISETCKKIILLPGSGSEKLKANSQNLGDLIIEVSDLSKAVTVGFSHSIYGDILLFSPAFSSKDQYNNEYERNDEFIRLVNDLV